MQETTTGFINGYKGLRLYYKFYQAANSQARIIFLHGAGEYSEKYTRFAEWFVDKGIDVYLLDLRGHGRSDGGKCHVDDFNEYVLDLDIFIKFIEKDSSFKNTFLVSHSLGGLISTFYTLNFPYRLGGIIPCSPCLGLILEIEPIKKWLVNIFFKILKNKSFSSHIKSKMATHDTYIIEKFKKDPLIHHTVTASLYIQMTNAMEYVKSHVADIMVPILILQADDDKICDPDITKKFYETIGSKDKTFKLYEGFYHELLNEIGKEKVFIDIYNWIKARC